METASKSKTAHEWCVQWGHIYLLARGGGVSYIHGKRTNDAWRMSSAGANDLSTYKWSSKASLLLPCVLLCSVTLTEFNTQNIDLEQCQNCFNVEKIMKHGPYFSNFKLFERNVMVFLNYCQDTKHQRCQRKGALLQYFIHKYITIVPKLWPRALLLKYISLSALTIIWQNE